MCQKRERGEKNGKIHQINQYSLSLLFKNKEEDIKSVDMTATQLAVKYNILIVYSFFVFVFVISFSKYNQSN